MVKVNERIKNFAVAEQYREAIKNMKKEGRLDRRTVEEIQSVEEYKFGHKSMDSVLQVMSLDLVYGAF